MSTNLPLLFHREFPPEPAPASNAYGFHTFNHYDLQPFFQARQRTGCVDFQIATGNRTRLEKGGVSWLAFFLLLDSVLTFRHTPALVGRMSAKISES
ncbi:hypothetical protein T4D_9783 [Trichinella pseudospiralis]|uniref:Uncharacterized protein n=1 Tax=Trichinella pseudospiralis TaxID=6337 RepID=A0A0V1FHI0_TRIPS|nr:hypothetical protein T4D_9783 [Trichinella pseudospiralis]